MEPTVTIGLITCLQVKWQDKFIRWSEAKFGGC